MWFPAGPTLTCTQGHLHAMILGIPGENVLVAKVPSSRIHSFFCINFKKLNTTLEILHLLSY